MAENQVPTQDPIVTLYENIKESYELPDFETFKNDLSDPANVSKLHGALAADGFDMPDLDTFSMDLGVKKKDVAGETLPEVVVTASKQSTPPSSPTSVSASASDQSPLPLEEKAVVTDVDYSSLSTDDLTSKYSELKKLADQYKTNIDKYQSEGDSGVIRLAGTAKEYNKIIGELNYVADMYKIKAKDSALPKYETAQTEPAPIEEDPRQKASNIFKTELAKRKEQLYTEAGDPNAKNKAIFEVNQSYRSTNESPNYATALENLKRMRQEVFDVTAGDSESRNSLTQNLKEDAKGLSLFLLKDRTAIDNWQSQGLNPAKGIALDFIQVFEPEKYKAYQERVAATPTGEAAGVGKQIVDLELENTGIGLLKTGLAESYRTLQQRIAKANKGELSPAEQTKLRTESENLSKWIEYTNKLEQDQYTKYPEAISLEIDRTIQDIDKPRLGQGERSIFNLAQSIAGTFEDGLSAAYAGLFLNDKEKVNNDLEVLAKTATEGNLTYTTQDQSLFNRPFITTVSDDVKAKIGEVNSSSLSEEEKYKKKFELLKQARKDGNIYTVVNPNKSKVNWTGEALLNTVTSVAPQVIGAIALSGATGGYGATTKLGQLSNLFAVTASQSYGQRYNQAIQEGSENPYFDATVGTLIDAGTELFGNDIAQIKKVFGTGAAGKILNNLAESDWKRLMANKTGAFRNFGKVILEQSKDVVTEAGEEGLAQGLDNLRQGKPIGEGMKETILSTAIGFLPLKVIGLPMAFKNANMVDKLNLYSAGFNKTFTMSAIDNQLKAGEINKDEADRRKGIVNQMNGIIKSMPMFDAKGNPLSDEKKATYAFNQYIKLNSKETEGLPTNTVNIINQAAQEADAANGAILEGQPEVKPQTELPEVTVKAGKRLFNEPNPETKVIATEYKQAKGIDTPEGAPITKLDENKSKSIADAYDAMENNPNDPEVKAAYEAMAKETKEQYDAITNAGVKFEIYEGEGEPYKNSEEMIKDVRDNKHLFVLSTEKDFGQNPITDQQRNDNPLLRDSGAKDINGKPLLMNDVFRGVHDFFGHTERGNSFGAVGEENAWDVHARMFTPLARRAMTTETRGQNSWVNFGKQMRNEDGSIKKKGDPGYLSPTERAFAEQKIGLLPEEFSNIEDNYTAKSPKFTVTADAPVDLPNVTVKSPIHKKVIADVNQAAKALASSGVKFKIYDNADSFATESGQDKATQGVFIDEDGTVSINLDAIKKSSDWNIAWHESSHPVMNIIRNTNRPLYDKMANGLAKLAAEDKNAAAIVGWSENNYEGKETQVDEAMVESIALMADGTIDFDSVPLGTRQAIIDFINEIAKYLGLDPILSDTSKATFIKKAKEISNALKTGTDISEVVGKENVKEFKNNIGENVGEPTQLKVGDPKQEPVQFKESYPLSFVKPEDKIDIKSLIDEIQAKGQKVWFWVADQLGRGNYYDSVIDGEHYLDAGPSFALDPKNRKEKVIWATGKGEKFINDNIKKSDYLFIISGSPSKSKLFNKSVADITVQRLKGIFNNDYAKFKEKINSISKISGLNKIVNDFNSFEELLESPKRKDFLIALDDQKEKKGTELKKFLDENKLFVDYESLRDGFYKDNDFQMNDIMLVLKPTGFGGVSDHSTYQNNVLGTVVGVPDKKINAYDIMTPEFKAKYPELASRTQQSQTIAPYGSGIKGVASPVQQKKSAVALAEMESIVKTAKENGTYLKAPNGKATRLTPDQWATVRTNNFKNWFGDWEKDPANASKVVDSNGEPKVVYHGSGQVFDEYSLDYGGTNTGAKNGTLGFFFTDNKKVADSFGGNMYNVFLNMKNPIEAGYFSYDADGRIDKRNTVDGYESVKNAILKTSSKNNWTDIDNTDIDKWRNKITGLGYDGVIIDTQVDSKEIVVLGKGQGYAKPHLMHIAFEPNQIKSATDNTGEFSKASNKIQQKVGNVELPAATQKQMTEDDKGNYLFYHYSDKNIKKIDPSKFGSNTNATGRDERPGVGISMYYTRPDVKESNVPSSYGYVVRVPKAKVYPFNQDPLNLIEPARRMFEKQYPGQAFDPNKQVAWVSKAAAGRGYPMTVAEWNIGRRKLIRAQTTEALKPERYSNKVPGTYNQVETNPELEKFKPNAKKRGQAKIGGGVTLEDLKDYNSLPNVEMAAGSNYVPLSKFGITSLEGENVKSVAAKLAEAEGPYQPIFKAISTMPNADKVKMYDLGETVNVYNQSGGMVAGLYSPAKGLFGKPQIGVATGIYANQYSAIAHEMMHWVTLDSINKYKKTPEYKSIENIYNFLKAKHPDIVGSKASGSYYGLQNFNEFMAELLTNKDFRDNMAGVMAKDAKEFERTAFKYKVESNADSTDLITLLVQYVTRVMKDMMDSWGKKSGNIDFSKPLIDNATDLAVKAFFADRNAGPQLSMGGANVDADTRKSVANMLGKLEDKDIVEILKDEKGLTEEQATAIIEDVKYDPELNPTVDDIVGEVGEGERARGLSKTFPDRGVDTIAKINSDAKKYFVVSNKQTAAEAQAFIDEKNPEDALDYLLTQPTDIPNRVRIWMSGAVMDKIDTAINEAQLKGDKETAQRLSTKQAQLVNQVAPLGTELGQAIQAFRRFYENSKGSPSMLQFYIKKITDQVESEKGKPLTDEERQNIVDLAKQVQAADDGLPKDEATYALGNYVSSITPVAATDIMEAIWYAHILSGITTQSTNFFANLWNSFAEGAVVGTREAIKTKSVMPFINGIQGFLSGIKQGANDAADIIKTGVGKQDGDKFKQGNILEFFSWKQVVGDKVGKVLDWAPGYSPKVLKYVGRALAATDAAFSRANSEAISRVMAYNIAKEEGKENPDIKINKRVDELLNKTAEKKAEAGEKAKAEGYLEGTTRYRRRVGEILEAGRSKELKKEADEFGKRVTLNYEPEGFMRPVYKLALAMQQSTKLTRMFIPFTRIVVNLTENSLNYTPLGFVKAAVGSTTTDATLKGMVRRRLTPDERADFAIKATIGLSTFLLLSGLTGEDDDDLFEITANGSGNKQKNYELMKSGWRPYSIKTKEGRYISYKDWPIAPILAAVGAMHDSAKYNSSDQPTDEATIAAQAMVISLYDKSVMKGLQDFVEIIDPKEEYNQSTKMFDRLKNWGADQAKTMAVSNFTQQAIKFTREAMDSPIKAAKGVERIYRDIPYLNDGLNPILDVFGEPVTPSTSEKLLPITLGKPSKDEVLAAFNENGIYIGKPKTRDLYVSSDPSNEETRPMTDQEYYQYTKRSGQITKQYIMEDWNEIKEILAIPDKKKRKAELKAYTTKVLSDAREEALSEFPNQ